MEKQYFRGFKFTHPEYRQPEPLKDLGKEDISAKLAEKSAKKDISDKVTPLYSLDPEIVKEVMPDFVGILVRIGRHLGCELTLENREILLVSIDDLKPINADESAGLVNRYGEYMKSGGSGDCKFLPDGKFRLRVGISSRNRKITKSDVLKIAAHEYGHTLCDLLSSPIYEELKAFAFDSLFERFYYIVTSYKEPRNDLHPDRPHDVAVHRLGELLRAGIPEGAILSHIADRQLGRFRPLDYLAFLH